MKILVADDSPDIRDLLALTLKRWGYQVITADDGVEAFAILEREPVDLLVCDWMMPNMDGLELCRKIRAHWVEKYLYIILLTGRDAHNDLVQGMDAGADDYLTKPVDFTALRMRVRAAERLLVFEERLAAKNFELVKANDALEAALVALRENLQAAARIQKGLLPSGPPHAVNIDVSWLFLPAITVGGDVFNFIELEQRFLIFYHFDVAGHGVPAAMMALNVSEYFRGEERVGKRTGDFAFRDRNGKLQIKPPEIVVGDLNRRFMSDEERNYLTLIFGFIDLHSGDGRLCQAGHPYPLIWRHNGRMEQIGEGGFPVGILPEATFESIPFHLARGDSLVLYSDGITECSDVSGRHYGIDRLASALVRSGREFEALPAIIQHELENWRGGVTFDDDISMMVLQHC